MIVQIGSMDVIRSRPTSRQGVLSELVAQRKVWLHTLKKCYGNSIRSGMYIHSYPDNFVITWKADNFEVHGEFD